MLIFFGVSATLLVRKRAMNKDKELTKIGKRIKELRLERGLSQAKLGAKIGKDQQSINKVEAGDFNPTYIYLLEICEGLEIELTELLTFKTSK